ncbi:unnamed protein product [Ranitomeya imitator]|uniref:Sec16 Sec23-binding domain-containing protein n=1 Tax=Ranitomeya imitator TaxID=111125 RepID=A0ABN9LEG0_9NEOB|nr:unnamed protein product [Ranitomeya imitator]
MKSQLWGHALFLASKMDSRTYSWVMARFTSTLAVNDPLQTLFQLMTGRVPQAASFGGDKKWGDWRPHLAVMLSNPMSDPEMNQRAIIAMGDNLVLKGLTEAGHCCYLTAGISLGKISEKSDRLVLLGSNQNQSFKKFASTANIQRAEILEYCQILGKISHFSPSFQARRGSSDPLCGWLPYTYIFWLEEELVQTQEERGRAGLKICSSCEERWGRADTWFCSSWKGKRGTEQFVESVNEEGAK